MLSIDSRKQRFCLQCNRLNLITFHTHMVLNMIPPHTKNIYGEDVECTILSLSVLTAFFQVNLG